MKYRGYEEYKNAESKWLDTIPVNWERTPIKHIVSIRITDGPHETPDFVDEGVPFLSAEAVKNNALDFSKKRGYITRSLHEVYSKKCLPNIDDVFMVKSGNTTGSLAIVETNEEFNIWSPLALIRANKKKILPRFIFYSMQADFFKTSVELSWSQGTQPNIGMGVIENLHIAIAPLNEQSSIISFLDHETAKIDTLIEKQQQLIKLLKEKRQAVISHAVTKGLNPNAPMRDSGVEWLGEVPEHWELPKLIHKTTNIGDGLHSTPKYQDGTGYYFVNGNNLVDGKIVIGSTAKEVPENEYKNHYIHLDDSSILLSINGTIGNVARYQGENIILGKSAAYINCANEVLPVYLMFYLQSSQLLRYYNLEVTGTTIFNLSLNSIRQMKVTIPPEHEQTEIADYCIIQKKKYEILINKASVAIELMQERRTALISAAVTGKIDVRNWVAHAHPCARDIRASLHSTSTNKENKAVSA